MYAVCWNTLLYSMESNQSSKLAWRRWPDLPETTLLIQAVVVQENVYKRRQWDIHRYDPQLQQWTKQTLLSILIFSVNNQLTVVGGWDTSSSEVTADVAVYSTSHAGMDTPLPTNDCALFLPSSIQLPPTSGSSRWVVWWCYWLSHSWSSWYIDLLLPEVL